MYKHCFKRIIDIILSFLGIVIFAIPMIIISIIIKTQDSGPALFKQKRVGKKKDGKITYFKLYKLRSMKMSAPHDIPTHQFKEPEKYLLKCGNVLRKYSIDELPQLFNILKGDMAIFGPRPALWNQIDLIAEREKYGANDIKPGLTGWAQINGRDELEIPVKAKFDGEYVTKESFLFDFKCFWCTIIKVFKHEGFVEGKLLKRKSNEENIDNWS